MSKLKSAWGALSPYAESFAESASKSSLTKASVVGAGVGAGYAAIDQGSISAPLTGSGALNTALGVAAGLSTRKYATSIYNKVDDHIMRQGINRKTYDSIYDKAQDALRRRKAGGDGFAPKSNPVDLGKFEEFIKSGKDVRAMRFSNGTYNVAKDRIDV